MSRSPNPTPGSGAQDSWAVLSPKLLTRLALYSLLLYCIVGSLLCIVGSSKIISFHGDLTGGESVNPFVSILAVRTGHLYHPLSAPPYTPQPFGPLFYLAGAGVARLSSLDLDATFRLARTLDFICLLLCAVTVWLISRRLKFSPGVSALAAMMFLAQPIFYRWGWGATMRPDVPALLLMLLALYFALRTQEMGFTACVLAGSLVGIGFLLKQSAAAAGIAIAFAYLFNRRYKQIVTLALSAAAPVGIAFALLVWHHEPFLDHFLAAGRESWSLAGGATWLAEGHLTRPTIIMLFAVGSVGFMRAVTEGEQGQTLAAFAAVNVLAGFATIPQLGGQINYFIPGVAGCALLLTYAIRAFMDHLDAIKLTGILVILAFLAALADCAGAYLRLPPRGGGRLIPPGYLSSLKVLSDDDYIELHTRDPEVIDPFTVHSLELQGRWSSAGIVREVQSGSYDVVILNRGRQIWSYRNVSFFAPAVVDALNENYEILCGFGDVGLVLKPRSREAAASPEMLSRVLGWCGARPPGPNLAIRTNAR